MKQLTKTARNKEIEKMKTLILESKSLEEKRRSKTVTVGMMEDYIAYILSNLKK